VFSAFFINRPVFAGVISIVLVLLGLVAASALPIARYPEIAPPTVQVTASYPGADATTLAETVATPLEQEINGVEGMVYLSSVSSSDGRMTLNVTFEVGTDIDMATVLVQNRVAIAEAKLPEEVKRQGVTTRKQSVEITLLITLDAEDPRYDDLYLSNFATRQLKDELTRVNGVGSVAIFGAGEYAMRIWLDPTLLRARGMTTNDVLAAIREQNVQVAAGQIGAPPAPSDQPFQYTVNTTGRFSTVEQFEEIVLKRAANGALVKVKDVARVELGSQSYSQIARFNGSPTAVIAIYQLPGANAIELAEGVRARLAELSESFPEGVRYSVVYESTDVIEASIHEVIITLFIALALVIATVYVFLQSFRATLIPAITIPVSLIATFAVMLLLGFSINILTLFGLVLVIGIVVDDAIVVVENVTRHLDESGMTPKEAALKSMQEVSGPIIATTLVLLAVFVPTAFLPGIAGQLFQQFALTIAIATLFSSINALTLSPALAAIVLRPSPKRPFVLFRLFNKAFDAGTTAYVATVRGALRVALLGVLVFAALVVVAIGGLGALPKGFVPQEDEGWCMVNIQLPDGAALARSDDVMRRVQQIAMDTPGVADVITVTGYSIIDGANLSNGGVAFVIFESWDERGTPELHQNGILAHLNRGLAGIQEANTVAFPTPSLPGVGTSGGLAMQLQDRAGVGLDTLQSVASEFAADGMSQAAIARAFTTFRSTTPQLFVDIDREQVKQMGVPLQDVFDALGAFLGSAYVNDFADAGRIYQVRTQAEARYRAEPRDIELLEVRNARGDMVPLGSMIDVQESVGPAVVTRYQVYPSAKLIAGPAPGFTSGQAMGVLESMARQKLPAGMGFEWTELALQQKLAGGAGAIFILAVVLVYLVLAAQYESWTIPISVIAAVPTAILGAVAGLTIRGLAFDVYGQIGLVLLIGLAAKSAILITEFAKSERESGKSIFEAAVSACRLRFRAILMTAFSFILGVLPLLVASGAGAESRIALGTIVFAGMVAATALGVLVTPLLYFVVQWVVERVGGGSRNGAGG